MKTRILALVACLVILIPPARSGSLSSHALHDDRSGTAEAAAQNAWQSYQGAIADSLIASNRPRDWALAANMLVFSDGADSPCRSNRDELLGRAARAAPDDVLVQWMGALEHAGGSDGIAMPEPDESIQALTRLQPDNAASWMMRLALASKRNDPIHAEDALARMASSARYDDHFADTLHAWLDVSDRFPPPNFLLQPGFNQDAPEASQETLQSIAGFTSAFAQGTATAIPAYQALTTYCKPGKDSVDHWQRFAYCEDVGRLMLVTGKTLIARSIGFSILRNLRRNTATDQQERDNLDWYMDRMPETSGYKSGDYTAIEAYQADWRNLDDEIEIRKRALRRAGLPDAAPAGWIRSSGSPRMTP